MGTGAIEALIIGPPIVSQPRAFRRVGVERGEKLLDDLRLDR
ncbi:MAG: hypothetical protein RIC52_06305 [Amphiplicatus sp.]